ncbi:MAG: hypothetical protein ACRD8W_22515 [Nitrososphaeraceae archaeon]
MRGLYSGEIQSGVDGPYRYFFRIRIGTIAGNILIGIPFFMVAEQMYSTVIVYKIKRPIVL